MLSNIVKYAVRVPDVPMKDFSGKNIRSMKLNGFFSIFDVVVVVDFDADVDVVAVVVVVVVGVIVLGVSSSSSLLMSMSFSLSFKMSRSLLLAPVVFAGGVWPRRRRWSGQWCNPPTSGEKRIEKRFVLVNPLRVARAETSTASEQVLICHQRESKPRVNRTGRV